MDDFLNFTQNLEFLQRTTTYLTVIIEETHNC